MSNPTPRNRLTDFPLWRLIVMLHDAEQLSGADSETTRTIASVVQQKMKVAELQEAAGGRFAHAE